MIKEYAQGHLSSSYNFYKKRNTNLSEAKAFNDIVLGKSAEFWLYKKLKSENKIISKPDLKVYTKGKSYQADMMAFDFKNVYHLHVKCISESFWNRGIKSVLLEKSDKLVSRPWDCKNHFLVITRKVDDFNFQIIKWLHVPDAKYDAPLNNNLQSKVAVYL